jgi:hypothetical protein
MRLPIDECIDERLRLLFPGYDCQTARFASLSGLKNGRLIEAAEAAGFDVLITVDQNIPDQQNLAQRKLSLLILCGPTNRLRDLAQLVPAVISVLGSIGHGGVLKNSITASAAIGLTRRQHRPAIVERSGELRLDANAVIGCRYESAACIGNVGSGT